MTTTRGFTLLEVLIAMAIFSIVGLASFELLRTVRNIDRVTDRQTEAYQELVRTLALMDRDFIQLRYREIRDELGDRKAAVAVNEGITPLSLQGKGGTTLCSELGASYSESLMSLRGIRWSGMCGLYSIVPRIRSLWHRGLWRA